MPVYQDDGVDDEEVVATIYGHGPSSVIVEGVLDAGENPPPGTPPGTIFFIRPN